MKKKLLVYMLLGCSILFFFLQSHILSFTINYIFHSDTYQLKKLADNILTNSLMTDPISLHFFFVNKDTVFDSKFHYHTASILPVYQKKEATTKSQSDKDKLSNQLDLLHNLNTTKFTKQQRLLYDLINDYLNSELVHADFPYMDEPLSPTSGVQIQLPLLLAEYPFRSAWDVDQYLNLLSTLPDYFSGITVYEVEKSQNGRGLSDAAIKDLLIQLDQIMDVKQLSTSTHFLQTSFADKINSLLINGKLSEQEKLHLISKKDIYIAENNRILTTLIAPAYTELGDQLLLIEGSMPEDHGLCYYENGSAYYHYLLEQHTGCSDSIGIYKEKIMEELLADFTRMQALRKELQCSQFNNSYESTLQELSQPVINTIPCASSMLFNLNKVTSNNYPIISYNIKNCTLKQIDASLAPFSAPAFYCIPPIDLYDENSIYLNPNLNADYLTLFSTIAHEGYPGHLYQTLYQRNKATTERYHPLVPLLQANYTGYIEGWATYVESTCYDYESSYYCQNYAQNETMQAEISNICELYSLQNKTKLCMLTLLDFAIHEDGITRDEAVNMLSDYGLQDKETIDRIYTYIVREPATYPSYCIGYLSICKLKQDARSIWKDQYSDYRFHKAILEYGPAKFSVISSQIFH